VSLLRVVQGEVAAARHARSLRHECKRQRGGRASSDRYRVCDRHAAAGRVLGRPAFSRLSRATRAENPARRAHGSDPCWLSFARMSGKGPVSHGAPSPRHITERVARDTPRARRCETPARSASSVYAISDHSPIVATFED
jgi:hypothetical protein